MELHKNISSVGILVCLLAFVTIIYYPALDSRFLLDDVYNLAQLEQVKNYGINYYIFGGFAGPSGRPLSLLSFALQYQDWPNNPAAFKTVNFILHLLNGILVWFLSRKLISFIEPDRRLQLFLAFFTTALWLLHPMQMSTVLYTIQRMTQLSAFFSLLGILGYLYLRPFAFGKDKNLKLLTLTGLTVWGCALLAILSKENGILLLFFILLIEITLLSQFERSRIWKAWATIFLFLPLFILVFYLASSFAHVQLSYEFRSFTLEQRLLTQAPVLFDYLRHILVPSYGAFGLYHDDYPISTTVLDPPFTLVVVIGIFVLLAAAIKLQKSMPVFSFSIGWFFIGHLLESTYLNLELYFEHRNYLPILGISFGLAWLIIWLYKIVDSKKLITTAMTIYLLLLTSISWVEARVWSRPAYQAMEWARLNPDSIRALDDLAAVLIQTENHQGAIEVYDRIYSLQDGDIYGLIQKAIISSCQQGGRNTTDWNVLIRQAESAEVRGLKSVAALDSFVGKMVSDNCEKTDVPGLMELLMTMISNPAYKSQRGFLHRYLATLHIYDKAYDRALVNMREAIRLEPEFSHYVDEIYLLKLMGRVTEMQDKISRLERLINKDPRNYLAYNKLLAQLKTQLR